MTCHPQHLHMVSWKCILQQVHTSSCISLIDQNPCITDVTFFLDIPPTDSVQHGDSTTPFTSHASRMQHPIDPNDEEVELFNIQIDEKTGELVLEEGEQCEPCSVGEVESSPL